MHDEPHRTVHSSTQILKTSAPAGHSSMQFAKEPPGQPDGLGLGLGGIGVGVGSGEGTGAGAGAE